MSRYLLRRLLLLGLAALIASSCVFFALRLIPGDPALNLTGMEASAEQLEQARRELGEDKSLPVQYAAWMGGLLRGDFGVSYLTKLPVSREILRRLPVTLPLSLLAFALACLVSLPLGIAAAVKKDSAAGVAISAASSVGVAVPVFWIGIILVWTLALEARVFPAGGFPREGWADPAAALRSLALPALTIAVVMSAAMIRYVRSAALDVLGQEYLRTARSLGYGAWAARFRHGVRNMAVPLVALAGIELTTSLVGAVVVENVFALPGLGSLLLQGVKARDFPVVQDIVFLVTAATLGTGFLVEAAQRAIDPRLRRAGGAA